MKDLANCYAIRRLQNFEVYVLSNGNIQLAVVPELGAKIISLKNQRTGREWLWHPPAGLQLFKNKPDDEFSISPLVGIDECLPTIVPGKWRGRELPDHGEVWNTAGQVERPAWEEGLLKTQFNLPVSPFEFERTVELRGNEVRFAYELRNLGAAEENFVWAMHPLLRLEPGDELQLPDSTRGLLNAEGWLKTVATAVPEKKCAKIFASPVSEGWAAIANKVKGDRLEFAWDAAENNALGLWLTRGGWHGHHHFSIEPTNAAADSLALAAGQNKCGVVAGNGSVSWRICLRVGL